MTAVDERAWWKEAVFYQLYPRSFNDSNGDGVGDLQGMLERVDHIADLGADVVWLNPVYDSPNADAGYDIRDYRSIMDEMGTMADWEAVLEALHERDVRLIMDIAVNHTSDEHEWFQRSRAEPDGPYGDFYIWREGRTVDGEQRPPNNWIAAFGGSAWTYDEARGEYYLHLFDEKQPDLNWDNPAVREAVYEEFEFWLEEGIDGFRLDVINLISKADGLPDGDPDAGWVGGEHFVDGPRVHEYISELCDRVFAEPDVTTVGEMPGLTVEEANRYLVPGGDGLHQVFFFDHVQLDRRGDWWNVQPWSLPELKEVFSHWQTELDGWAGNYLGNHDQPRSISRFGNDGEYRVESQKLLATFLFTLRGSPYIYQGEEIGMTNYPFSSLAEIEDASTSNRVELAIERGDIESFEDAVDIVRYRCRDNARTPMQWDDSEHAGFTDGDPWLPVNPNHEDVNVERDRAADDSIFAYYQELVALRDAHDALVYGEYELLLPDHGDLYVYTRSLDGDRYLVALNWANDASALELPADVPTTGAELLVSNYDEFDPLHGATFRPWEARVYRLA